MRDGELFPELRDLLRKEHSKARQRPSAIEFETMESGRAVSAALPLLNLALYLKLVTISTEPEVAAEL